MEKLNKFFVACAGIALILGFIAFGYILYQLIGFWTALPTAVFIGCSIAGLSMSINETKRDVERRLRLSYENAQNSRGA